MDGSMLLVRVQNTDNLKVINERVASDMISVKFSVSPRKTTAHDKSSSIRGYHSRYDFVTGLQGKPA